MRRRSTARRNSVLTEVPEAGTHLAPGTKILLIVSNGRRR
jgi:beta-lactam-binding protein with PASTA domain